MPRLLNRWLACFAALASPLSAGCPPAHAATPSRPDGCIRVATYNVAMFRDKPGQLRQELQTGTSPQALGVAEVLRRVRPDVVLINEFDYEAGSDELVDAFRKRYLESPRQGLKPLRYEYFFYKPVNTGVDSGRDLDGDGQTGGPADAWGYGRYPGQYGMLLLSRLPIGDGGRTYQRMRWRHLASPNWPRDPRSGEHFYSADVRRELRLASKSFWDVELKPGVPGGKLSSLRVLCAHPTPPGFDGPEDRNGRRNFDEIRMVAEYISGGSGTRFVADGESPGEEEPRGATLPPGAAFVVLGDLNADPVDGGSRRGAIRQLLDHPAIDSSFVPTSEGAAAAAGRAGGANERHSGDPRQDTSDFGPDGNGNLRIDYVLPSRRLRTVGGGVFWPLPGEPGAEAATSSDHRLVWLDLEAR